MPIYAVDWDSHSKASFLEYFNSATDSLYEVIQPYMTNGTVIFALMIFSTKSGRVKVN